MYTNVNLAAPLGALAFHGTGFVLLVVGLVFIHALIIRKPGRARFVLLAGALLVLAYLGFMLVFSLSSSEKVLARGQEKHFCEIDCHLAYSIFDVRQAKTVGNPPNQTTATGIFQVVTIKTRFDEQTISSTRGNGLLTPNSRVVTILDDRGRSFSPSIEGERALAGAEGLGTTLTTPLRPGESYTTTLVFDLPPDIRNPRLLMREGELVTHFVIGHENSLLHKRTSFGLGG